MQQINVQSNKVNNILGSKVIGSSIRDINSESFIDRLNLVIEDTKLEKQLNIAQANCEIESIDNSEKREEPDEENEHQINYLLINNIEVKVEPKVILEKKQSYNELLSQDITNGEEETPKRLLNNRDDSHAENNEFNKIDHDKSLVFTKQLFKESQSYEKEDSSIVDMKIREESINISIDSNSTSNNSSEEQDNKENQTGSSEKQPSINDKSEVLYKDTSFKEFVTHNNQLSADDIKNSFLSPNNGSIIDNKEVANFKISKILSKDENHIEISLTPENLGKINVRIEDHAQGTSKLIITADNQETLNLLSENIKDLHRELKEIGIKTDNSNTEFNLNSQNQQVLIQIYQ